MSTMARTSQVSRFGPFELDLASGELRKAGISLKLHPQPFRVLTLLLEQPGKIVTREEIQHCLWNGNTLVDFDGGINFCVRQIRSVLADDAEKPRYIETVPRRGYRFIASVDVALPAVFSATPRVITMPLPPAPAFDPAPFELPPEHHGAPPAASSSPANTLPAEKAWPLKLALAALCLGVLAIAGLARYRKPVPKLTAEDTIVLADFKNATGEHAFDGALNEALGVEMAQSPFLNLLPTIKTAETLRMMGRSLRDEITHDVAQEVCVRTGSKALVNGTISKLGSRYLLSLNAEACNTGVILGSEKEEAADEDGVLRALSRATSNLRVKLGESLHSVQKYDVPIQATTSSLEALRDLDMAARVVASEGDAASLPFVERALQADPNFALANSRMARRYMNLNQPKLALDYAQRAYDLRDHVTERENLEISATYFRATGDLESLDKVLELWKIDYPRDMGPHTRLCVNYGFLGRYEEAVAECEQARELDPASRGNISNLADMYLDLNRFDEAQRLFENAPRPYLPSEIQYEMDFLHKDFAGTEKQVSAAEDHPGEEDEYLSLHSNTFAYFGRFHEAQDYSRRATESARRAGLNEAAALWQMNAALRNAEVGRTLEAKRAVAGALQLSRGKNVLLLGAVALARTGNVAEARKLGQEIEQSYPNDTLLKLYWGPVLQGAIALKLGDAAGSVAALENAEPYDLAKPSPNDIGTMYPPYLRGEAYLSESNGAAAEREFQKILDHPGIVSNFVTAPLAQLGIARAYAVQGDGTKAKAGYEQFFALWKDADPDIPILKQAKAEYAKLQ
jgi:eukaryotic-like serine/threonine-protein kinase